MQMEVLQRMFSDSNVSRAAVDDKLNRLADAVDRMTERMQPGDSSAVLLERIATGQERLVEVLESRDADEGMDAESRMRLRSIDVQLLRILEEISAGRQETVSDLRGDLGVLIQTIRRAAGEPEE